MGLALLLLASAPPGEAQAFVWPNVPERIEKALSSSDPAERRGAARQIAALSRELAKPLLLRALADDDVEVRVIAARAAARVKLPGASEIVAKWLTEPDAKLRLAACEVIRAAPGPGSVNALSRVLSDPSTEVRAAAAQALGRTNSADAVSLLLGHLDDSSPEVRTEVVVALGRLADARAVLPLVGKVQDASPEVRRRVVRALGDLRDARAGSALVLSLSDAVLEVRVEAALALGRIGVDDATVALSPHALSNAGSSVKGAPPATEGALAMRQAALRALARIGSARAIDVLVSALEHDRPEVGRTGARDALVAAGTKVVPPLTTLLSGAVSERAAIGASLALATLGDKSSAPAIVRAMQRNKLPANVALRALETLAAESALPAVLELLADPSPDVRRAAIKAAAALIDPNLPDGRAIDPVRDALSDPAILVDERAGLIDLLGRTASPRAAELVTPYLTSKSPSLRRAALRALGAMPKGSAELDKKLVAALDDELGSVRMDAAIALSKVGTGALGSTLLSRLLKGSEEDRGALGIAVAGVLARSQDAALVDAVKAAVPALPSSARDALVEGLGRMQHEKVPAALAALAETTTDDRRKVAEVSSAQGTLGRPLLRRFLGDPDAAVRANAAWGLGSVGEPSDKTALVALLSDPDAHVAANAAASLGRIAERAGDPAVAGDLCKSLNDGRAYVRANALSGARSAKVACDTAVVSALLASDPSERVRISAASLLHAWAAQPAAPPAPAEVDPKNKATKPPPTPAELARRALERCSSEETTFRVAQHCERGPVRGGGGGTLPVTVFVVPEGQSGPAPRAAFALVMPDGSLRTGIADRRGAVFEPSSPRGKLELAVPSPLLHEEP